MQTEFVKGDFLETEDLRVSHLNSGEYKDYNEYLPPADGYDCEAYYFSDEESLDAALSAGRKTKGMVMFEVPIDAKEVLEEYEVNFWTEDKIVFVVE